MPRRDAISEKKKERLMQEHEQLQKLMLQARSSARRSSLKEDNTDTNIVSEEVQDKDLGVKNRVAEQEQYAAHKQVPEVNATAQNTAPQEDRIINASLPLEQPKPQVDAHHGRSIIIITPPKENTATINSYDDENRVLMSPPDHAISQTTPTYRTEAYNVPDAYQYHEEEQPLLAYEQAITKRRKNTRILTYSLLLIAALLAGFGGYYFYMKTSNQKQIAAGKSTKTPPVTATQKPMSRTEPTAETANENETITPATEIDTKTKEAIKPASSNTKPVVAPKTEPARTATTAALGQYKVLAKAYFHNAPDESTRRKAFITHWNNAVLTPVEEKNGFFYIVFTNHLGQTSKGWIRKKDLQKLN